MSTFPSNPWLGFSPHFATIEPTDSPSCLTNPWFPVRKAEEMVLRISFASWAMPPQESGHQIWSHFFPFSQEFENVILNIGLSAGATILEFSRQTWKWDLGCDLHFTHIKIRKVLWLIKSPSFIIIFQISLITLCFQLEHKTLLNQPQEWMSRLYHVWVTSSTSVSQIIGFLLYSLTLDILALAVLWLENTLNCFLTIGSHCGYYLLNYTSKLLLCNLKESN